MPVRRKKIRLGDEVEHTITGLKGVVTAKTIYLNGCVQYEVQPRDLHQGMIVEAAWIDEPQLKLILPTKQKKKDKPRHGGMRNHPPKRK